MATKKKPIAKPSAKPAAKPKAAKSTLQNLAARPAGFDDLLEEPLVDHSGVFRVTTDIAKAQTGHDEETSMRFANDSLVMAAQRDGFREDGPALDEVVEEHAIVDEATAAERRQRLITLAARAQAQQRGRGRRA